MLTIDRKKDQSITIGRDIAVTVIDVMGDQVRLGIEAPKEMPVDRKEVYVGSFRHIAPIEPSELIKLGELTVRPATELDLAAINFIYNHYVANSTSTYQEQPDTLEARQQWLAHHGVRHPVIVAELDDEVVGWGSLSPFHSRSAFRKTVESSVYVHHEFHRRGIGAALLSDLIDRARSAGHHTIIAAVDSQQAPSLALHERFGFTRVAHMKEVGFKFGKWLDVIDLQLML